VKARQFANSERQARPENMRAKLAAQSPLDEPVALFYRNLDHEYELRARSRRGDKAAARSEAIGWIKSSVRRLSGNANVKPVAILCSAVLGTEISEAAVKKAFTKEELPDRRGIPLGMSIDVEQVRKSIAVQEPGLKNQGQNWDAFSARPVPLRTFLSRLILAGCDSHAHV
jgi:hypothetical protein